MAIVASSTHATGPAIGAFAPERVVASPPRHNCAFPMPKHAASGRTGPQTLGTVVARRLNTGDGAQVFVDGVEILIAHVPKRRPRHDLEQRAVEGTWEHGVQLIRVDACSDGLFELGEGVASDRQPGRVRGQIAGNDIGRAWTKWGEEHPTASEIGGRIDPFLHQGWRQKERVSRRRDVLGWRPCGVAPVTLERVDEITSQSHQFPILLGKIQLNGGDVKAAPDS
jgi:hypothetical protein